MRTYKHDLRIMILFYEFRAKKKNINYGGKFIATCKLSPSALRKKRRVLCMSSHPIL